MKWAHPADKMAADMAETGAAAETVVAKRAIVVAVVWAVMPLP